MTRNSPECFNVRRIAPVSVVSEAERADQRTDIVTVFSVPRCLSVSRLLTALVRSELGGAE